MTTFPVFRRPPIPALVAACLLLAGMQPQAAEIEWIGGPPGFFDDSDRWVPNSIPGPGDLARFQTGGVQTVLWNATTGDGQQSAELQIFGTDVELKGDDGPHLYTLLGDASVTDFGLLRLDRMILDVGTFTAHIGTFGAGNATLDVTNGGSLTAATLSIGEDLDDVGASAMAIVRGAASSADIGTVVLGRADKLQGVRTGTLSVEDNGVLEAAAILVAADNRVQVLGGGAVTTSLVTLDLNAELEISGGATLTGLSVSGPISGSAGINSFGATINILDGARVQGFSSLTTSSATGLLGSASTLSGDTFISVDGPTTSLALSDPNGIAGSYTGLGLGFGNSAEMYLTNGATMTIATNAANPLPGGFAIGQDVPANLEAVFGSFPGSDGPTGGSSLLQVSGSTLVVTGQDIRGTVGSSTTLLELLDSIGLVGLENPGGNGTLEVFDGGVVELSPDPGGFGRLVAADTIGSFAAIRVSDPGSTLDAGNALFLGAGEAGETEAGNATLDVNMSATVKTGQLIVGRNAAVLVSNGGSLELGSITQHGGTVDVAGVDVFGAPATITSGGAGLFIDIRDGRLTFSEGADLDATGGDGFINVSGELEIRSGARVRNLEALNLGAGFSAVSGAGSVLIDGAGTVVDLVQNSAISGAGLFVGWESDSVAMVSNGAVVNIGDSAAGGPQGGLMVGASLPALFGTPLDQPSARLTVSGSGSRVDVVGDNVAIGVGSPAYLLSFFELNPGLLPPALLAGARGSGTLEVLSGGAVSLAAATSGGSVRTTVADTPGSIGVISVAGAGSTLAAGNVLALGVDAAEQTAGEARLSISDGGAVFTDRLVVGATSMVNLFSGATLTTGEIVTAPANFGFHGGTFNLTAQDLVFGAGGLLGQLFTVESSRAINVTQDAIVNPEALLLLTSNDLSATRLVNNGETVVDGLQVGAGIGSIENNARLSGSGRVAATVHNNAGGEIRATASDALRFTGSGNTNDGDINVLGGTVEFSQDLTNNAGGFIGGRGVLGAGGGLTNNGVMAFSGVTDVFGNVDNLGQIIASGSGTLTFFDDLVHNGPEIRTSAAATTVFFGAFSGAGPLTGGGSVFFEGDVNPGNSPGLLAIDGDASLGIDTDLTMEIGGYGRGTEYDAIDATGTLTFAGNLTIELVPPGSERFLPQAGDFFELFMATTFAGSFANLFLPTLGGGVDWDTSLLESQGLLGVSAVPIPPAAWLLLAALAGLGMTGGRARRCAG